MTGQKCFSVLVLAAALALSTATTALAYQGGATNRHGGPGGTPTCTNCHDGASGFGGYASSVDAGGVQITSNQDFDKSSAYSLTFNLEGSGASRGGFNLYVYNADLAAGASTGSFSGSGVSISGNQITHEDDNGATSGGGRQTSGGDASWSFTWNTPSVKGNYTLYYCGNPVDGDGSGYDSDDGPAACGSVAVDVVNNDPVAQNDSFTMDEDSTSVTLAVLTQGTNDSDPDGDSITITSIAGLDAGVSASHNGTTVTYTPAADNDGTENFTYTISDGDGGTDTATVTVNLTPINDSPAISNVDNDFTYTEDDPATTVDGAISISDLDSTNLSGAVAEISSNCVLAEDRLEVSGATCSANSITCTQTNNCTLTLSGSASLSAYDAVLQAITYRNISDTPTVSTRTVRMRVTDDSGNGATENSTYDSLDIAVAAEADAPTVADFDTVLAYTENDPASLIESAIIIADADSANLNRAEIEIDNNCTANDVLEVSASLCSANSLTCTTVNNCYLTVTGDQPFSNFENVLEGITYRNTSDDPSGASRQLRLRVRDNGNTESIDYNNTITFATLNDDPVAGDDAAFTVAVGSSNNVLDVLANDSDVDSASLTITLVNGSAGPAATTLGGTVSINGANDRVLYTPPADNVFGEPSPGGSADSFTYTVSDGFGGTPGTDTATVTVNPVDTDADGFIDYQDNCPATANNGQDNNDGDSEGDICDDDDDNDGIDDTDESAYPGCLDPFDETDAAEDCDGDGVSNLDEINAASDPVADDVAPTIVVPGDLTVDATGYLTAVDLGEGEANDTREGLIAAVPRLGVDTGAANPCVTGDEIEIEHAFRPGRHTVYWTAQDNGLTQGGTSSGTPNCAYDTQQVDVRPLASIATDQFVEEGQSHSIAITLSGDAPAYPVTVSIGIGGTADGADYEPIAATVTINAPAGAELPAAELTVVTHDGDGAEGDETLEVTMLGATNAALGRSAHVLTIVEGNVAPTVSLAVAQGADSGPLVVQTDGTVVVTAAVTDANPGDAAAASYDWRGSHNALTDSDGTASTFSFDPTTVATGLYTVTVTVADEDGASAVASVLITVRDAAPALSAVTDTDGDGTMDQAEGFQDSDADGIADYLDDGALPANLLQTETQDPEETLLMQAEEGVVLTLGETARYALRDGAMITLEDVATVGGTAGGVAANGTDDEFENVGGLFDFEIAGLVPGASTRIVLPLRSTIRANATYRKFDPLNGWRDFVVDDANLLLSARRRAGVCPGPGDDDYQPGLTPFDDCLQLLVEDGGPNDADGVADGVVRDPGGVGVVDISMSSPARLRSGSAAALHWGTLILLLLGFSSAGLRWFRLQNRHAGTKTAAARRRPSA